MKNSKNGFLAKIAWHYLCQDGRKKRAFSCTLSVLTKHFFGPKQCKPGKTIKIVVSPEIAQNQSWHLFFEKSEKVFFWHGWKSGFYELCFWKTVFFWKHYFCSVFNKTQLFKSKTVCWKNRKYMKNSGLFLNMAKWWVCFSEVLMLLWFVFGVFGIFPEVLKMLISPFFEALVGWLILLYFGFGRFRCFCVSCVCFCFLCCFCFCFVCFVFV